MALVVKNLPAKAKHLRDAGSNPWVGEDPLEECMETHPNILAYRISQTEEAGGLQAVGSHRVGHN